MKEIQSDILNKFDSVISEAVKREIRAILEPVELKLSSYGKRSGTSSIRLMMTRVS